MWSRLWLLCLHKTQTWLMYSVYLLWSCDSGVQHEPSIWSCAEANSWAVPAAVMWISQVAHLMLAWVLYLHHFFSHNHDSRTICFRWRKKDRTFHAHFRYIALLCLSLSFTLWGHLTSFYCFGPVSWSPTLYDLQGKEMWLLPESAGEWLTVRYASSFPLSSVSTLGCLPLLLLQACALPLLLLSWPSCFGTISVSCHSRTKQSSGLLLWKHSSSFRACEGC